MSCERFITFGSIPHFNKLLSDFKRYKKTPVGIVNAVVSEKIHGANASVCYGSGDFWVQSRNKIIRPGKDDNYGCAAFVMSNAYTWMDLIRQLAGENDISLSECIITVYFEWCGGKIQTHSAVTGLDTRAIIFQHFKVSPKIEGDFDSMWITTTLRDSQNKTYNVSAKEKNIFNIMDYKTWSVDIDFNLPYKTVNELCELVNEVEKNSFTGQGMGINGNIGEGVVVTFEHLGQVYKFKAKGQKHTATKVKTLSVVDGKKEEEIIEFVNSVCDSSRLEQAWQTTFGINNEKVEPQMKYIGEFLKAVVKDVFKEELDVIKEKGFQTKKIAQCINSISRHWFINFLQTQ